MTDFVAEAKRLARTDARFCGSYRKAASYLARTQPALHAAYVERQRATRGRHEAAR